MLGLEVVAGIVFLILPLSIRKPYFETLYSIWFELGETVFPSGPGGHALPGGAIVGFFFGMFVYAAVLAVVVCLFRSRGAADQSR